MAYTKTTWANGDVITADKMNHAENGISANDAAISGIQTDLNDKAEASDVPASAAMSGSSLQFKNEDGSNLFSVNLPGASPEQVAEYVTDWLDDNVDPVGSAVVVDASLSIEGAAADAKATGDAIAGSSGLTDDIKAALLQIASKVAYIDDDGQDYYDDLYDALYPTAQSYTVTNTLSGCTTSNASATATEGSSYTATITASSGYSLTGATVSITMGGTDITTTAYSSGTISISSVTGNISITVTAVAVTLSSISAVYTQSGTVYDTDSLDSLKSDLVVTATYSDSSTATVPSADYTLSGTLTAGTSTITVSYSDKTTTFNVTVSSVIAYSMYNRTFTGNESQYIDTGINLFAADMDWSIACDLTQTTAIGKNGWRILTSLKTTSPYNGFYYGSTSASNPVARIKWMATNKDNPTGFGKDFVGRHRIVFTHAKDSGLLSYTYRNDTGISQSGSISETFSSLETENLHIAGVGDNTSFNYIGTVNAIEVYTKVLSAAEINTFLGVS